MPWGMVASAAGASHAVGAPAARFLQRARCSPSLPAGGRRGVAFGAAARCIVAAGTRTRALSAPSSAPLPHAWSSIRGRRYLYARRGGRQMAAARPPASSATLPLPPSPSPPPAVGAKRAASWMSRRGVSSGRVARRGGLAALCARRQRARRAPAHWQSVHGSRAPRARRAARVGRRARDVGASVVCACRVAMVDGCCRPT